MIKNARRRPQKYSRRNQKIFTLETLNLNNNNTKKTHKPLLCSQLSHLHFPLSEYGFSLKTEEMLAC